MRRLAGFAVNLGLAAASVAVALVLAEQLLRAIDFEPGALDVAVGGTSDARAYHVFEDSHFVWDPELIWRPRAGFEVFNAQGFRGPELDAPKMPGEFRVVAVGDSNTLGWGGAAGAHWPGYLHLALSERDPGWSVVNAGVYGYTSFQGLRRFREALALEPDLVLISFGSNDAHPVALPDREFARRPLTGQRFERLVRRRRVGQLLTVVWGRLRALAARGGLEPRVPLDEYRANLTQIATEARERGVGVVLLTRPYTGDVRGPRRWKTFAHLYNAASAEVADSEDLPLVDLYTLFKGRAAYFADESHFTAPGHRLAAEIVLETLEPLLPVPRDPASASG